MSKKFFLFLVCLIASFAITISPLFAEEKPEVFVQLGHSYYDVFSVTFSPDGRLLASGSEDGTIKLWDVNTGEEIRTLKGHSWRVRSVAFSPDGRLIASGSGDWTIKLWDVNTGRER
jgi:WD40 repeat protein